MSLSFKQIQDMLSMNLKLVGQDIDAMRGELAKLKMINFQLMANQQVMLDTLKAHNIECKFESIVEAKDGTKTPTNGG